MAPMQTSMTGRRRAGRADVPVVLGALTGGLLASSCCVVQLALNSLSVGCAGLSVFKPYRPGLRLLTAGMLALLLARHGVSRGTIGTAVASLLLTFSDDALAAVNRQGSLRLLLRRAGLLGRSRPAGDGGADEGRDPALVRWSVDVEGMRCQACAARVRGSVAALYGVRNATVELERGRVEVFAEPGAVEGGALSAAIGALDVSYAVRVAGPECFTADDLLVACGGEDSRRQQGQQGQHQEGQRERQQGDPSEPWEPREEL